jgi:hypothetical protein
MTLPNQLNDREYAVFDEKTGGQVAKHVIATIDNDDPISVTGSSALAAPTGPMKLTVFTVTDTAQNPIPTPQTNRVALVLRNLSVTETVYVGPSITVTADDTSTGGWEVGPGEDFSLDYDDNNGFYTITQATKTAKIKLLEIASTAGSGGGSLSITRTHETPSGLVNSSNTIFSVSQTPFGAGYFDLYLDGVLLRETTHYTRSGVTITMTTAPETGQELDAVFWY